MKKYRPNAGIVLLGPEGKIFCGKRFPPRAKTRSSLLWQMPQGGINDGEDPQEAAKRELFEETGIQGVEIIDEYPEWISYDFPPKIKRDTFKGIFDGQTQKWFLMHKANHEPIHVQLNKNTEEPAEFQTWAWMTPDEILKKSIIFRRAVYRRIFKYFKLL